MLCFAGENAVNLFLVSFCSVISLAIFEALNNFALRHF